MASRDAKPSRRQVLGGAVAAGLSAAIRTPAAPTPMADTFVDILRVPDLMRVFGDEGEIQVEKKSGAWVGTGVEIVVRPGSEGVEFELHASVPVRRIQARWSGDLGGVRQYLGDHWERGYGDLEWRGEAPNRIMPWYFLTSDGRSTHGYGVSTGPRAMCFWTADRDGISLWMDVRNGTRGVRLGDRSLSICRAVSRKGKPDEGAFAAARAFCRKMCEHPRLPSSTVYGTNDWYYAYGNNSAELIAQVSGMVAELSPVGKARPFSVIDDGWSQGGLGHGPWEGNDRFGPMDKYAERLRSLGVRPGIWFRPLTPLKDHPKTWRSRRDERYLDPTVPEVAQWVGSHIAKLKGWGYELIKHDFTTWDTLGRWGFSMGSELTGGDWSFADSSRTTAEVILDLYRTIREAAGDVLIDGCNTFSHLTAGIFELYRAGDDTSGVSWDRTRRMGVNTLAFRAPHHGAFYSVDADIVAITEQTPWDLTQRWMDLLARSGTPFFVSPQPAAMGAEQKAALKKALALAVEERPLAEPLDWMATVCPSEWKLGKNKVKLDWMPPSGSWPFAD